MPPSIFATPLDGCSEEGVEVRQYACVRVQCERQAERRLRGTRCAYADGKIMSVLPCERYAMLFRDNAFMATLFLRRFRAAHVMMPLPPAFHMPCRSMLLPFAAFDAAAIYAIIEPCLLLAPLLMPYAACYADAAMPAMPMIRDAAITTITMMLRQLFLFTYDVSFHAPP